MCNKARIYYLLTLLHVVKKNQVNRYFELNILDVKKIVDDNNNNKRVRM